MNIINIPYKVYKYYFSIDNIEQAKSIQSNINEQLNKCISDKTDLIILKNYIKDFKSICNNIINRNKITTSEEYTMAIKALNIINSNAQSLLYSKKYRKGVEIKILQDFYNEIDKLISFSKTPLKIFIIVYLAFILFLIVLLAKIRTLYTELPYEIYISAFPITALSLIFSNQIQRKLKKILSIISSKINNHKEQQHLKKLKDLKK